VEISLNLITALKDIPGQIGRIWKAALVLLLLGFLGGLGTLVVWRVTGVSLADLTRDPTAVMNAPFYIGLLSTAGLFLWAAAAGVSFLGTALLSSLKQGIQEKRFLFASGLVSLFLGLDDAFLFHEELLCVYLSLPQSLVYGFYILCIGGYFLIFLNIILRTDFLILALAVFFLGSSVGLDAISDHYEYTDNVATFLEDLLKFVGIVFWLAYQARTANSLAKSALRPGSSI
jgi:hypothetical protein